MGDRGQTGFDFLAGMSVFLLTVGFVFGFAPGMFSPFTSETGTTMIVADRTAASLAEHRLADSATEPGRLNETCTEEFFDADGVTGECSFDADAKDLETALGVQSTLDLNVTIEDNGSIVTLGVPLAAGPGPNPSAGVTISQRIVFLDGEEETLFVRVW
jgi:hypothetical protein